MTSDPQDQAPDSVNNPEDISRDNAPGVESSPEENMEKPQVPSPEPAAAPAPETVADEENGSADFAAMLAAAGDDPPPEAKPGDELKGTVVQIGDHEAFVDCGLRNELPLALDKLRDADGKLPFKVGDEITGHVAKGPEGLKLTMALDLRDADKEMLEQAFKSGTPVEGKVGATNKGGFAVALGNKRGFCPFSQIDVRRADDPSVFVGKTYKFKILELSEDGRNIVVSRRALLQAERENQAKETRATLKLGDALEGTVTRLVPFGAFVDIGGLEGLVHISQISHQRVGDPSEVLKEGQPVKVKVLEIQNLGQGRSERISLSIKALATDPWPETAASLTPGTDIQGKVTRLVDFGVFVQLQPGVEGLIHISELANRRIIHPREVINEGDEITVRILDVDLNRRRISLSRKQAGDYEGD